MKKFLSILLALAVGFTFTFGSAMSAFAGVDDVKASLAKACDKANMALEQNYKEAKAGLEDINDPVAIPTIKYAIIPVPKTMNTLMPQRAITSIPK